MTGNLKQLLGKKLTSKELEHLRRSYDVIGSIALLEIPPELVKKQALIAKTVLDANKQVTTVMKKTGKRTAILRVPRLVHLAGERTTETLCLENGVRLKTDVAKVYFSHRMATERKRLYGLVKKNERVLVMFSGVGPYTLEIAKHTKAKETVGIEKNPAAHRYAEANKDLNKVSTVTNYKGDVRTIVPTLGKFDRIIMPLPKGGEPYLDVALRAAKKGTTIHYYDFQHDNDIPSASETTVVNACKKVRKQCKILQTLKCGQLGPRQYRVCVDFKIL